MRDAVPQAATRKNATSTFRYVQKVDVIQAEPHYHKKPYSTERFAS